jgi:hypothetical protein
MQLHESIDEAESRLSEKYNILLVIHMDPLNSNDEQVRETRRVLDGVLASFGEIESIHDFRVVGDSSKRNLIFDAVVDGDKIKTQRDEDDLRRRVGDALHMVEPRYNAVMNIDRSYVEF